MLKKKVKAINAEIGEEYNLSEKKAIVSYILMDTDEQKRVNLPKIQMEFQVRGHGLIARHNL
jgi:hypothetical protein